MNGADTIINVFEGIAALMTPTLTIDENVAEGTNWRLDICNTYWITPKSRIEIGGLEYRVEELVINKSILISGPSQPLVSSFQLSAPSFFYGSHRKINNERKRLKNLTAAFIYLPTPEVTEDREDDSDIAYTADIRPIFLKSFNQKRDKTELQQADVIEPLNQMVDYFLAVIEDNQGDFNEPDTVTRKEWPSFGDPTTWGNDKLIFDQPLAGVEARLSLDILYDSGFLCCGEKELNNCPDVTTSFNGTPTGVDTAPGQNIEIEVIDQDDVLTGTLEENAPNKKKIRVNTGGAPVTTDFNGTPTAVDTPGGTNLSIDVVNQGDVPIGTLAVDLANQKKIVFDTDNDIPRHYVRPALYPTTSVTDYDQEWHRINGTFDYTIPAGTAPQALDPVNPDKLLYNNVWGHKFRFVGENGGYYDPSDGNYYDVNGVLSDLDTEFKTNAGFYYIIDEFTGLGWDGKRGGQSNWATAVGAGAVTRGNFNDFYLPTIDQLESLRRVDVDAVLYLTDRPPFDIQLIQWSCTPFNLNPTGNAWRMLTDGQLQSTSQGSASPRAFVRAHYT